jgi:hypothetical protein
MLQTFTLLTESGKMVSRGDQMGLEKEIPWLPGKMLLLPKREVSLGLKI